MAETHPRATQNFTPVGEKILVRHLRIQKEGALYLPEKTDDRRRGIKECPALLAEVMAVGNLKDKRILPGMKVQMNPYSGTELRLGGQLCAVYAESDILAVVEE
jgi:co-chaperonin GroES (HSP10)